MHQALARWAFLQTPWCWARCGTGNFMGQARRHAILGVELDAISGRIARAIYPGHDIRSRISAIRAARGRHRRGDRHVPFARSELDYQGQKLARRFLLRQIGRCLKPGGVLARVTSHFALDKQKGSCANISLQGPDFVGAIRLPSDAFKREGTAVSRHPLLRRRAPASRRHEDGMHRSRPFDIEAWKYRSTAISCGTRRWSWAVGAARHALCRRLQRQKQRRLIRSTESRRGRLPKRCKVGFSLPSPGSVVRARRRCPFMRSQFCRRRRPDHPPGFDGQRYRSSMAAGTDRHGTLIRQAFGGAGGPTRSIPRVCSPERKAAGHRPKRGRASSTGLRHLQNPLRSDHKTTLGLTKDGSFIRRRPSVKFREDPDACWSSSLRNMTRSGQGDKAAILHKTWWAEGEPVTTVGNARKGCSFPRQRGARAYRLSLRCMESRKRNRRELGELIFHDPDTRTWQTADAYYLVTCGKAGRGRGGRPQYHRTPRHCGPSNPKTCCRETSTPISGHPGFPKAISELRRGIIHVEPATFRSPM